jgi:hypothetical protein
MLILEDAQIRPDLFCWFGAIPEATINEWIEGTRLRLPTDLLAFWKITGGGDAFESETLLRPTRTEVTASTFVEGDDAESRNAVHRSSGMDSQFFVFEEGAFISAVDLNTRRYVTLHRDYTIQSEFLSFDQWYEQTLRIEFGPRYGLPPLSSR